MKVKLLSPVRGAKEHAPGDTIDVSEKEAAGLIAAGAAEPVVKESKAERDAREKAEQEAAERDRLAGGSKPQ
jgi:hypothetical protein